MSKLMKTSEKGKAFIQGFEKLHLQAYIVQTSDKYWTIGWGHYGKDVKQGQKLTRKQADTLFEKDVKSAESYVNNKKYCPVISKLNQHQFDALVSFTYNAGAGNLKSLCRSKNISQIGTDILLYNNSQGTVLKGLVSRRKAEQNLFNEGKEVGTRFSSFINEAAKHVGEGGEWTWKTSGSGRVQWCAAFIIACAVTVGGLIDKVIPKTYSARGIASIGVSKKYGTFYPGPGQGKHPTPQVGDLVSFYNSTTKSRANIYDCDHIGIVYEVSSSTITTIEGNTKTWDLNTSKVSKNTYDINSKKICGYYRPDWDKVGGSASGSFNFSVTEYSTSLYDEESTREDATMRMVGYLDKSYEPSIHSTDIQLSVINYTSYLQALTSLVSPANINGVTDTSKLSGKQRTVVEYLLNKKLNGAAACGILGNIMHESTLNTAAVGDHGTSFGICQWHLGRGSAMKKYVGGGWANDLSGQLDYLWYDLTHNYKSVLNDLKAVSNDVQGCKKAADSFVRKFEVPADVENETIKRQETAVKFFNKLTITQEGNPNIAKSLSTSSGTSANIVKTIEIPSSVNQSGLTKNYTNYTYFFPKWSYTCRKIADIWDAKGRKSKRNIATIDSYYLIAMAQKFGNIGDIVTVELANGESFNAILADVKGSDAQSEWGHYISGTKVDMIEWESIASGNRGNRQIQLGSWAGVKVVRVHNRGAYLK